MKIELKNVKTFRGMEGYGLNATVYVNGIKCCFVIDEGNGGCFRYEVFDKKLFAELEEHAKQFENFEPLDALIDKEFNKIEKEKFAKKMQKYMLSSVLVGKEGGGEFGQYKFKVELTKIPKEMLQKQIDKIKTQLREGETILNTNLQALGITI